MIRAAQRAWVMQKKAVNVTLTISHSSSLEAGLLAYSPMMDDKKQLSLPLNVS